MKRIIVLLVVLAMMVAVFTGCTNENATAKTSNDPAATEDPAVKSKGTIKIGALLDYTGVVAELGPKFKAGIELALEEVDYKVAGYDIELVAGYDCASDVTTAIEQFKMLTEKDGVNLIIGPLMGDCHLAIAPLAAEKDVIITSLVNGMYNTIATSEEHYLIYPTTCEAQTTALGKYAYENLGYQKIALVTCNFAGKIAFNEGVRQGFEAAGGTIVQEQFPELGCDDYSSYIATLAEADAVVYALNGPAEVSKFVYQYNQSGKTAKLMTVCQDADYTPEALAELGDIALNIPGEASYSWQIDSDINAAFVKGIQAKTGNIPSSSEQNAYTLTKVFLAALEATGGDSSYEAMWDAITSLELDTPAGMLSFTPEGVAVSKVYLTQAEKAADGTYQLSRPTADLGTTNEWRLD